MTNYRGIKCSENLHNLCVLLEKQHNWIADPSTFKRTYAGCQLKSGGAFSWIMRITDESGYKKQIGSQEPLSYFAKRNTVITIDYSWHDIAIWSNDQKYSESEYQSDENRRISVSEDDAAIEFDINYSKT